jgi:hypothetical protein
MKLRNAGEQEMVLNTQNPVIQNMIISTLREAGVNVYENTTEFDPEYKTLVWDGEHITQSACTLKEYAEKEDALLLDVEQFMDKFSKPEPEPKIMQVGEYEAVITAEIATVGCQKIPYDVVKAVYECMTEMKN